MKQLPWSTDFSTLNQVLLISKGTTEPKTPVLPVEQTEPTAVHVSHTESVDSASSAVREKIDFTRLSENATRGSNSYTLEEIKTMCKERGIKITGKNKAQLVQELKDKLFT